MNKDKKKYFKTNKSYFKFINKTKCKIKSVLFTKNDTIKVTYN